MPEELNFNFKACFKIRYTCRAYAQNKLFIHFAESFTHDNIETFSLCMLEKIPVLSGTLIIKE